MYIIVILDDKIGGCYVLLYGLFFNVNDFLGWKLWLLFIYVVFLYLVYELIKLLFKLKVIRFVLLCF